MMPRPQVQAALDYKFSGTPASTLGKRVSRERSLVMQSKLFTRRTRRATSKYWCRLSENLAKRVGFHSWNY